MAHAGACHVGKGSGENLVTIGVVFFVSFWSSSFLSPSHARLLLSSFPSRARLLLPFLLPLSQRPSISHHDRSRTTAMRRPDPWRRPAPPSGGDVRSLRLARPAIPSVPRCRQYGSLGWGRQRGVVCAGGGSGDRAASDRGFRRRQAVDLSRRLHFLLPHFKVTNCCCETEMSQLVDFSKGILNSLSTGSERQQEKMSFTLI
ncbi:uncharacterized protein LOC125510416 [Triticum urartu]|uniref:uncharacterized protein LOC125510416 n=1 Tax=Triticum urartu TaxID=4572 RepID=UPI002043C3DB|nr:uncharacterized protein LOC125510416 [Triticum urartu]